MMRASATVVRDDEAELLTVYRESLRNDRVLLPLMLEAWQSMTPAQLRVVCRVADLFVSASRWRTEPGRDPDVILDLDALTNSRH
jgi:hypothetical protein